MIRDVYPRFRISDPVPDSASGYGSSFFLSIPYSGVKKATDTRSRIRIRNQRVSPRWYRTTGNTIQIYFNTY